MATNQDYSSSKKRVRIFVYEFDGYYSGDQTVLGSDGIIKEDGGFLLILASVLFFLSLLLLGIDLALSPLLSFKQISDTTEPQVPTGQDIPYQEEQTNRGEGFHLPRNHLYVQDPSLRERSTYNGAFRDSTRSSHIIHHNTPASQETSFTNASNLRPREYWL